MTTIMTGHSVMHRRNNYVKQCAIEHLQPSTPLFPASVLLALPLVCCCVFEAVSSSSCYRYISCKMVLLTYVWISPLWLSWKNLNRQMLKQRQEMTRANIRAAVFLPKA